MLQQVAAKTDGIPLFVEELTKMVLESELFEDGAKDHTTAEPLPPVTIPSTLHDSLMARLDRLGAGKQVAQLGATLGREFTYDLIRVVSSVDEVTLQRELTRLTDAELLYQRGLPPHARYAFKHALIQDAAYQSLLKSQRQQYHRQIALVLEERFAEIRESQPELLAHHYTEAGLMKDAIVYWQRAGQRAIEHSANVEAIGHLTKGLAVLRFLPNTPERTGHELTLQLTLGAPLMMIRGQTAPEVERTYIRAHELCQHGGDNRQKFAALAGLCGLYLNRAQLRKAHELGEECLALAEGQQDPVLLQEAHRILGSASFFLGHFTAARRHLEHGVAAYDPHQPPSRAFSSGADPRIVCLSRMAWALWMLGYPDQALKRAQEALVRAEESSHAYSLVFATYYGAVLRQSRREAKLAQEGAERATALARDHGFIHWVAAGTCMRGWALAEQGLIEEGLVQLWQGLTSWLEMGIEQAHTHLLSRMAEAYRRGGRAQEGLRVLSEAFMLAQTHKNEERYHEAELYRLKGHLLLLEDTANEQHAEKCFRHAVDVARQQQAKSLELRAAMSLSCLWQARGRTAEARGLLTEISGWFTEGFATADLQEARSLLEAWV
jgi:predicted ATPase